MATGQEIPEDASHLHFGDGSTETELDLTAGVHTLCLQAGDGVHTALDLTDEITITVVEPGGAGGDTETEEATGGQEWEGTYTGTVVWDCGPTGERQGTLDGSYTIVVDEDRTATMEGDNTVEGSCAGPRSGKLTTPITVTGQRTSSGFEFPASLWGPPGTFTISVTGNHGTGTLMGPAPGPATITLTFEVDCPSC